MSRGGPPKKGEVDGLSGREHRNVEGHTQADVLIDARTHRRARELVIGEDFRAEPSM